MAQSIRAVIAQVLKSAGQPMSATAIFQAITDRKLYAFKAQDPLHVVTSQMRCHCLELNFPSSRPMKYFSMLPDGRFRLLDKPVAAPPNLYETGKSDGGGAGPALVSVPTEEQDLGEEAGAGEGPSHSEIQWRLLALGAELGLDVWAPTADRGKEWGSNRIGDVPRLVKKLPLQFNDATTKTIENIDVLWLERYTPGTGQAIIAGFEVEHTTPIYSGLLRMADLLTLQPKLDIKLYLVAPDERFAQFASHVVRPTFSALRKPLHSVCRFLPYTGLLRQLEAVKNVIGDLKPQFLDRVAELFDPEADEGEE